MTFLGAYLANSRAIGKHDPGRLVLGVSVLPHLASIVSLLALTPDDWSHTITRVAAVGLIGAGFLVLRSRRLEG